MVSNEQRLRAELDDLLSESVSAAVKRECSAFEHQTSRFHWNLVLAGAGNFGRNVLRALRQEGIEPLAFVDANEKLWSTRIDGLEVLSHAEGARRHGKTATFCVTIWRGEGVDTMAERMRPLRDLGCVNVIDFGPLAWRLQRSLLPHYSLDLPHKVLISAEDVRAAFDLWADDASRAEYVAQVRWRLRLDFDNLPLPVNERIYFPTDLYRLTHDEVFVDCGAYSGDTIRDFLALCQGNFRHVYAFEADPQNFRKLEYFVGSLATAVQKRIRISARAVSDHAGELRFSATGTAAAAAAAEGVTVACVPLDDEQIECPTIIKMDIEGSEVAALQGATGLIRRHTPLLCVCVYHSQDHLWKIPLQVAANNGAYRFHLRPHLRASWDLVMYAIPPERSI
jgi:FkbM family methyltransferase